MNKVETSKKGFTIVELLVAIVVIGILVAITIVSYGAIQQRARDSERSSDVTQIKIALDKYYAEKSTYPIVCGGPYACVAGQLTNELAPYLKAVPHDPKHALNSSSDYQYVALEDGSGYGIRVQYEARDVCKSGQNMYTPWWSSIPTC